MWVLFMCCHWIITTHNLPDKTYGEFPFKLIYELNGVTKIVEDIIICEFDGYKIVGESGIYRKWKSYLKSGNERITLLKIDDTVEIYFSYGSPEYYMDDPQYGRANGNIDFDPQNWIPYIIWDNNKKVTDSAMSPNEAWDKYKLKIIDWQYTKPIKNNIR